jgi:predicted DNA-binding protein (MmcQ/YjbR family)
VDAAPDAGADADVDPFLVAMRGCCLAFPEVEEVEYWGGQLFRVRRRRFALYERARNGSRWFHVLAAADERPALEADPRFAPSPHHPHQGWLRADLGTAALPLAEVAELLESAYRRVAGRELLAVLERRRMANGSDGKSH